MPIQTVENSNTFNDQRLRINEIIEIINTFGSGAEVTITGGTIDGVEITDTEIDNSPIGQTTRREGNFTTVNLDNALSIANGGTGSTDAAAARTALGADNAANLTTGTLDAARVPNLSASKITSGTFAVGAFGTNVALEVASAAEVSAKGTGNSTRYSSLVLQSDETVDKEWRLSHLQNTANLFEIAYQGTRVLSIDPSDYGFVLHSATGGSKGNGTINAKGFYKNGVDVSSAASDTLPGLIELATQSEVNTGSDSVRAVVPSTLRAMLGATAVRPSFNGADFSYTPDSNHPYGINLNSNVGGQIAMRFAEVDVNTALIYSDGASTWARTMVVGNPTGGFSVTDGAINAKGFFKDGVELAPPFTANVYTSNDTWNKPSGCTFVLVECIGGGGSGAKGSNSSNGASGGGGGGYSHKVFRASDLTSSVSVTVGASVAGATANSANGVAGNHSAFGSYIRANGGAAGTTTNNTTVAGGAGEVNGGYGGMGTNNSTIAGGFGEASKLGGGGGGGSAHGSAAQGQGGIGMTIRTDQSVLTGGIAAGSDGTSRSGWGAGDGGGRAGDGGTPGGGGGGTNGAGTGNNAGDGARGEVRVYSF